MIRRLMSFAVGMTFLTSCGAVLADASRFPNDVSNFLANREACDHFRGEVIDPPDAELKRERNVNIATYCTGTDKQLLRLKKKYAKRRDVMKELNALEPLIERRKQG